MLKIFLLTILFLNNSSNLFSQNNINSYYLEQKTNKVHIVRFLCDSVSYENEKLKLDTISVKVGTEYKDIQIKFFYGKDIIEFFPDMVKKNIPINMSFYSNFDSCETIKRKLKWSDHYSVFGYLPYITDYYKNTNPNFKPYDSISRETIIINPDNVIRYSEKQIQNNTIVNISILVNSGSDKGDDYFLRTRFYFKVIE